MSDVLAVSTAVNNFQLLAFRDFLDLGPEKATLTVYGTLRPTPGFETEDTPLVVLTLAKPSGELVDDELRLLMDNIEGYQVPAPGGDAVWARLVNGAGQWVADGDVSDADGGGAFKLRGVGTSLFAGGYAALGTASIV